MNKIDKPNSRGCGVSDTANGRDTAAVTFITEPRATDLLCGLPSGSRRVLSCHQANLRLRTTLQRWEKEYCAAASSGNTARQEEVVNLLFDSLVQVNGLCFLRSVDIGSNEAVELGISPEITSAWVPMSQTMVRDMIQKQLGKGVNGSISSSTFESALDNGAEQPMPDFQPSAQALFRERNLLDAAVPDFHPSAASPRKSAPYLNQGRHQLEDDTVKVASLAPSNEYPGMEGPTFCNGHTSPATSRSAAQVSPPLSSPIHRSDEAATPPRIGAIASSVKHEAVGQHGTVTLKQSETGDMGQLLSSRGPKHGHVSVKRSLDMMESAVVNHNVGATQQPKLEAFRFPGPPATPSPRLTLITDADDDNYSIYSARLFGKRGDQGLGLLYKGFALPPRLDRLFPGYVSCRQVLAVKKGEEGKKAGIAVGDVLCWVKPPSGKYNPRFVSAPSGRRDDRVLLTHNEFQRHLQFWRSFNDCQVHIVCRKREFYAGQVNDEPRTGLARQVTNDMARPAKNVSPAPAPAPAIKHQNGSNETKSTISEPNERTLQDVEREAYGIFETRLTSESTTLQKQCQDLIDDILKLQSEQRAVEQSSDELFRLLQDTSNVSEPNPDRQDGSTVPTLVHMSLPDAIPMPPLNVNAWDMIGRYVEKMTQQKEALQQQLATLARDKERWEASLAKATSDRDSLRQEYQQLQAQLAEVLNRFKRRRTALDDL